MVSSLDEAAIKHTPDRYKSLITKMASYSNGKEWQSNPDTPFYSGGGSLSNCVGYLSECVQTLSSVQTPLIGIPKKESLTTMSNNDQIIERDGNNITPSTPEMANYVCV